MMTLAARAGKDERRLARIWCRLLEQAPFQARLVDCFTLGEPYLTPNALVLTPAEAGELASLTRIFAAVFAKAAGAIAADADLVQAMGFPWPAVELLQDEPPQTVLLGRFDFGLDQEGRWQLFEFNSDTPSGIREADGVERLLQRAVGAGTRRLTHGLPRRLATAVDRLLWYFEHRTGREVRTVGIVTQASYQEDLAQAAFLRDLLEHHWSRSRDPRRRAILGDIGNLWAEAGDLWLLGQRVDALYRLYPYELLFGTPLFAPLCEAVTEERLCLLNGLRGFLPQSKAIMAWIWDERKSPRFTPREQDAIACHLPPTYRLAGAPASAPRSAWVVKEFWGREGEEVYLGSEMSDDDWERCRSWGTFVAQRRITTQEVVGLRLEGDRAVSEPAWASVGAFVIDGRFAGCYSRVGGTVIDARAKYLATLVDQAGMS